MRVPYIRAAAIAVAAVGLGGCMSPFGYGGVSIGYGNGYYDPYYSAYSPYGSRYGYGDPYWGWYDGYYYPGTGYYVYDSWRRPYVWSDSQRSYWSDRRKRSVNSTSSTAVQPNWSDFKRDRQATSRQTRIERRVETRAATSERKAVRAERRSSRTTTERERPARSRATARERRTDKDD